MISMYGHNFLLNYFKPLAKRSTKLWISQLGIHEWWSKQDACWSKSSLSCDILSPPQRLGCLHCVRAIDCKYKRRKAKPLWRREKHSSNSLNILYYNRTFQEICFRAQSILIRISNVILRFVIFRELSAHLNSWFKIAWKTFNFTGFEIVSFFWSMYTVLYLSSFLYSIIM